MHPVTGRILSYFKTYSAEDKRLIAAVKAITGNKPFNLSPYILATQHSSIARENEQGVKESNERLEYLGDAILGAVVADMLFKRFPFKDEGFLTEMRSKIVNRESLNELAKKVGIKNIVVFDEHKKTSLSHKSIYGDTLEAFIGAIYLDKGFKACSRFIIRKLINPNFDLDEVMRQSLNFKSKIIEWAQKENHDLRFEIVDEVNKRHFKEFVARVFINDEPVSDGHGHSKKKAEQDAAMRACEKLNLE